MNTAMEVLLSYFFGERNRQAKETKRQRMKNMKRRRMNKLLLEYRRFKARQHVQLLVLLSNLCFLARLPAPKSEWVRVRYLYLFLYVILV